MSDISLAEFIVYGIIAYSSMLVLIISVIKKDMPSDKILGIARGVFLLPGMIASAILASSGVNIQVASVVTSNTIRSVNTTQVWTEATTQTNNIVIQSPVWQMFHMLLFLVLLAWVVTQILNVFTKMDEAQRAK